MEKYRFPYNGGFIEALTEAEADALAFAKGISTELVEPFSEDEAPLLINPKEGLRIYDFELVHPDFRDLHPSKLDFTKHLAEGITLRKDVEMAKNGRPIKATYTYNDILVAEIQFIFVTDAMNFLTRRTEKLGYYDSNNSVPTLYVISDWIRNSSSQYDSTYVMKERKDARISIFDEVRSKLNLWIYMYYSPQGKTYAEILNIGGDFWTSFSSEIDSWINTGGKGALQNKLMDSNITTNYPFLVSEVSPGVSVRDYIIDRITY